MSYEIVYRSLYFTLYKVQDGVFAAVATRASGAIGNAGIVDLGDRTLVFDTFQSPMAAADLQAAAEALTGKKVSLVVNSHWHFDHVLGNQVFQDALIISSETTRDYMQNSVPPFLEIIKRNRNYTTLLRQEASIAGDYHKRKELLQNAADAEHLAMHIDRITMVLPNTIVNSEMYLHGTKRDAHIFNAGKCHSEEDLLLYLPQDGVLFAGDLVFSGCHPVLKNGSIDQWLDTLQFMSGMEITSIIPGHGEVSVLQQVGDIKQYFIDIQRTAQMVKRWKICIEEQQIPDKYVHWDGPSIYYTNLQALCER